MKILMVSIFAPHFFNWTEQLEDYGHEIYWLDVFDSGAEVDQISFVRQITGWRYRWNYPGRYFIKKNFPWLNRFLNIFNERKLQNILQKKLEEIQPDAVHSFVMYLGTAPILDVMKKHPNLKWIYSSWGSDLYYYRHLKNFHKDMQQTFPYIDYMFADCKRDYVIAQENGFKGEFLGVFPGGGGFDLQGLEPFMLDADKRDVLLIKGYQGKHGKSIEVLKAIEELQLKLKNYKIIIFGADKETKEHVESSKINEWPNLKCYGKIERNEVLRLMGRSRIYIGNSTSDGLPNTLLEAIVMGAFPIQSNPGGATAEIIKDGMNGRLIQNPTNSSEIKEILESILNGDADIDKGVKYNFEYLRTALDREKVKERVLEKYRIVEKNIN